MWNSILGRKSEIYYTVFYGVYQSTYLFFCPFIVLPSTFILIDASFHAGSYHVLFDPIFHIYLRSYLYPHTEDDSSMSRNVYITPFKSKFISHLLSQNGIVL